MCNSFLGLMFNFSLCARRFQRWEVNNHTGSKISWYFPLISEHDKYPLSFCKLKFRNRRNYCKKREFLREIVIRRWETSLEYFHTVKFTGLKKYDFFFVIGFIRPCGFTSAICIERRDTHCRFGWSILVVINFETKRLRLHKNRKENLLQNIKKKYWKCWKLEM